MTKRKSHASVILTSALVLSLALPAQAGAPAGPYTPPPPNYDPASVTIRTVVPEGTTVVVTAPGGGDVAPGGRLVERQRKPFVRTPAFLTLLAGGAMLVSAAVVGGLALSQASLFHNDLAGGASLGELSAVRTRAHELAFASDLLFGTAGAMGLITLVLRFGTVTRSAQTPPDPESAGPTPGVFH